MERLNRRIFNMVYPRHWLLTWASLMSMAILSSCNSYRQIAAFRQKNNPSKSDVVSQLVENHYYRITQKDEVRVDGILAHVTIDTVILEKRIPSSPQAYVRALKIATGDIIDVRQRKFSIGKTAGLVIAILAFPVLVFSGNGQTGGFTLKF